MRFFNLFDDGSTPTRHVKRVRNANGEWIIPANQRERTPVQTAEEYDGWSSPLDFVAKPKSQEEEEEISDAEIIYWMSCQSEFDPVNLFNAFPDVEPQKLTHALKRALDDETITENERRGVWRGRAYSPWTVLDFGGGNGKAIEQHG